MSVYDLDSEGTPISSICGPMQSEPSQMERKDPNLTHDEKGDRGF